MTHSLAPSHEPLTVLELAFTVTQLGGWDNVELLTHTTASGGGDIGWMFGSELMYMNPQKSDDPDAWRVYDVRKNTHAQESSAD